MPNKAVTVVLLGSLALGCESQGKLGSGGSAGAVAFGEAELRELAAREAAGAGYEGTPPQGCEQRVGDFTPVQVWTGYAEGYSSAAWNGSIEMRFARVDEGGVAGELRFGDGPWDGTYTETSDELKSGLFAADIKHQRVDVTFVYTILRGTISGRRLRFFVELTEPWCAFCGRFVPVYLARDGNYECAPPPELQIGSDSGPCWVEASDTGAHVAWPCEALTACTWIAENAPLCICTQDSCTAAGLRTSANRHEDELAFDVTLESLTSARGSMDEYNVRFDVETIGAGEPENPTAAGAGGAGGTGASATAGTDAQ